MGNAKLGWVGSALIAVLGCGGGGGDGDMGMDMGPGPLDGLPALETGTYDDGMIGNAVPADLSCVGAQTAPGTGGSDVTFDLVVQEFFSEGVREGLCVKVYPDNTPTDETCDPLSDYVTDVAGTISLTLPASSWYAYRVFPEAFSSNPGDTYVDAFQVNFPVPPAMGTPSPVANSVVQATINGILSLLGLLQAPSSAIVAGTAFDCMGTPMHGAVVRLFRSDGTEIVAGTGPMGVAYRYFSGLQVPTATRRFTHVDGLYAVANVPVLTAGEVIFVELWGRRTATSAPEILGCEQVPLRAGGISIVDARGLRTDGPACPSLP